MRLLIIALSFLVVSSAAAEVIPVPSRDPGNSPTLTMYWEGAGSKALLLLIPGGEGQLNLKPTQTDVRNQFYQTLKQLTQGADPTQIFDVVLFDSPERLDMNPKGYPISRATSDHLSRIHSVIEFYKAKTKKPIWLMGHSNGAVSVTEYLRYEQKLAQNIPVAGLIVSGARKVTYFDSAPLNFPILFMSHRRDGCPDSDSRASMSNFEKVQGLNKAQTSFVFIETGNPENMQPCSSGYHMYNNATQEVVTTLRNFMVPFNP
jgi:pimeloyl-ACP methyl ester carboxylesterase